MASGRRLRANYDLWDEKEPESLDGELDIKSLAKNPKQKKKAKRPNYMPSIISSVKVPLEGASYNPSLDSYTDYVGVVTREEAKDLLDEQRVKVAMKMATSSKLSTNAFQEDFQIFGEAMCVKNELSDDFFKKEEEKSAEGQDNDDDLEQPTSSSAKRPKPKTLKQKRDARIRQLVSGLNSTDGASKKIEQQLSSLKTIAKSVRKESIEHAADVARRRRERAVARLVGKKRLGRGAFENFVEPVLLPGEINGSLRCIRQHTDILHERFNSYQRRNILPTPGDAQRPSKMALRAKIVEKRSVKAVKKGSRVI